MVNDFNICLLNRLTNQKKSQLPGKLHSENAFLLLKIECIVKYMSKLADKWGLFLCNYFPYFVLYLLRGPCPTEAKCMSRRTERLEKVEIILG